ncbi:hypothetical protein ACFYWP_18245 [Actinacidiphila glaucinigra]|uniref:hypothetical protein n=1 Tax=Actinacidiphila glaucinigra TaxID=235986 RepID=UPI00368F72F7
MAGEDAPTELDAVADELYGLPPTRFTAVRNTRAQAARKSGDRTLADRITALRRPTASAWAANLLAHEHPDDIGPFLRLGEALRQAHQALDGEQLRRLGHRQRELVRALSRQAGRLAADAGHPLSDPAVQEVEQTLHAALADPDAGAAFAEGRLTKPLSATVDLTGQAATGHVSDLPRRPPKKKPAEAAEDVERDRRDAERQRRREEARRAGLQARQAEQEARAREGDAEAAQEDLDAADRRREEAQRRLAALLEQVTEAEEALRTARDDQAQARRRHRDADRAARDARRRAGRAAAHAEQLTRALEDES